MKKKIDIDNSIIYKSMSIEDLAEAIPCLEHNGYFSDTEDFNTYHYGELKEVYASHHHEYAFFGIGNMFETSFKYFAPESSIVFVKDQRSYCYVEELPFKLGDDADIRYKNRGVVKYKFVGYSIKYDASLGVILDKIRLQRPDSLCVVDFTPEDLMNDYAIRIDGEWQSMSVDA